MIAETDFEPHHLVELRRQYAEEGLPLEVVVERTIERGLALELENLRGRLKARAES